MVGENIGERPEQRYIDVSVAQRFDRAVVVRADKGLDLHAGLLGDNVENVLRLADHRAGIFRRDETDPQHARFGRIVRLPERGHSTRHEQRGRGETFQSTHVSSSLSIHFCARCATTRISGALSLHVVLGLLDLRHPKRQNDNTVPVIAKVRFPVQVIILSITAVGVLTTAD